jgi:hypothetical protein
MNPPQPAMVMKIKYEKDCCVIILDSKNKTCPRTFCIYAVEAPDVSEFTPHHLCCCGLNPGD